MRFMVLMIPGDKTVEAGAMPDEKAIAAMMKFNGELARAGVLLALDGLHPTSKGARVRFAGGKPTVTDGPFSESKEVIGGFWIIDAPDLDVALQLAAEGSKACGGKVEVRPFEGLA